MPQRIVWTEQADTEILRLRRAGLTWDAIAYGLAVGRNSVVARGLLLLRGTQDAPPARAVTPTVRPAAPPPVTDRPPLPPGHPIAWAVLTEHTSLAGCAYPYPVFA
jgi:hypothetical protein